MPLVIYYFLLGDRMLYFLCYEYPNFTHFSSELGNQLLIFVTDGNF